MRRVLAFTHSSIHANIAKKSGGWRGLRSAHRGRRGRLRAWPATASAGGVHLLNPLRSTQPSARAPRAGSPRLLAHANPPLLAARPERLLLGSGREERGAGHPRRNPRCGARSCFWARLSCARRPLRRPTGCSLTFFRFRAAREAAIGTGITRPDSRSRSVRSRRVRPPAPAPPAHRRSRP